MHREKNAACPGCGGEVKGGWITAGAGGRPVEQWVEDELQDLAQGPRAPRRRVMAGLALPVVGGIVTGLCVPVAPVWFLGAGALLLLPLLLWVRHRWSVALLLLAAGLLLAAHARLATGGGSATALRAVLARPAEYVQFVVVALEDASPRPARPGLAPDAVFAARVEGLNRDGTWCRVHDRVRVVLRAGPADARQPRYGERWRLRGLLRLGLPRRSGLLLLPENQAVVDADRAFFLDAGQGNPVVAWCMERRRICRAILGRGLEDCPEQRGLVQSLMMGYREDLPKALRKDFAATGTVHIFAISGSHVAMVTVLIAGILRALGIPLTRWFPILAPLLVLYTIITGAATSAVRSCVMAVVMLAAPYCKRRPDSISSLFAAAIVILVAAPAQLGDLGFLLSFTAVAGLLAIPPVLDAWTVRGFRRDAWQLPGAEGPVRRWFREAGLFSVRYFNVTLGAWIATAPLTAYFFNLFSPVALAMNLLVIPAAFVILLAGVMSILAAPLSVFFSEVFNHAAWAVSTFLTWCIEWAAALPGGHWFVRSPPAGGMAAWYALLTATAIMARRVRAALPAGLALLAAAALAWGVHDARRCRVSVLDVGEGSAVLVQARAARILVDAGSEFRAENTLRQLRAEGTGRLDALVLTHADADHTGAAAWLLRNLPVRELWVPVRLWPSPQIQRTLREADAAGVPLRRLRAGDSGHWPGSLYWEVLWPPESAKMTCADDGSLALRVAHFGVSFLLMGDVGDAQERALLQSGRSLAASVLVLGRHGDGLATTAGLMDAVRPREAIVSAGPHTEGRHPDGETLARLAARGVRIWRTDTQGTLRVDLAGKPARWPDPGYRVRAAP